MTQEIQRRIVIDIDALIKQAQQHQSQSQSKPGSGKPGDKTGPPKPGEGQGPQQAGKNPAKPNQGGTEAARESALANGGEPNVDPNGNVKEAMKEWGGLTARDRQAVQEGASEQVIKKYQRLVEDYYRSLGEQSSAKK